MSPYHSAATIVDGMAVARFHSTPVVKEEAVGQEQCNEEDGDYGCCDRVELTVERWSKRVGHHDSFSPLTVLAFSLSRVWSTSLRPNPIAARNLCQPKRCSILASKRWRCACLLYTSPSPRDRQKSRMPSSA